MTKDEVQVALILIHFYFQKSLSFIPGFDLSLVSVRDIKLACPSFRAVVFFFLAPLGLVVCRNVYHGFNKYTIVFTSSSLEEKEYDFIYTLRNSS